MRRACTRECVLLCRERMPRSVYWGSGSIPPLAGTFGIVKYKTAHGAVGACAMHAIRILFAAAKIYSTILWPAHGMYDAHTCCLCLQVKSWHSPLNEVSSESPGLLLITLKQVGGFSAAFASIHVNEVCKSMVDGTHYNMHFCHPYLCAPTRAGATIAHREAE